MKNKKLSIRISEEDLASIHRRAARARRSLTDYVTQSCLGRQIVVVEGLNEVLRQQKAIGRNLNQLTTLCHMGKVEIANLSELKEAYLQMNELLSELLRRKRWADGDG